jgi:hypothetical protein
VGRWYAESLLLRLDPLAVFSGGVLVCRDLAASIRLPCCVISGGEPVLGVPVGGCETPLLCDLGR